MLRKVSLLFAAISLLALSACGGGGMSLPKMPVEKAQALNTELSSSYESVNGSWESAQTNAGAIGEDEGVEVGALDPEGFKGMMTECVESPLKLAKEEANDATKDGAVTEKEASTTLNMLKPDQVTGCGTDNLTNLQDGAEDTAKNFYEAKFSLVNNFRKDLFLVQTNGETLLKSTPDKLKEIAEIRAEAETALQAVEQNPIATSEQKAKAKADYETVIAELDSAQAIGEKITADFANLIPDAAALATKVTTDIQNFGQ